MAFLGDFGRIFLGGRTTRDVGGAVGETVGSIFGPAGAIVGGSIGRDIGKDIGEIGANTVDVSAPPAGVDSPGQLYRLARQAWSCQAEPACNHNKHLLVVQG